MYRVSSTPDLPSRLIQTTASRYPSPKYSLYNPHQAIEDKIIDIANKFKATKEIENLHIRAIANNELAQQLEFVVFILLRKTQMEWLRAAEPSLSLSQISQRVSSISQQTLRQRSLKDMSGHSIGCTRSHSLTPPPKNTGEFGTPEKRRYRPQTPIFLQKEQTKTPLQPSSLPSNNFDFAQTPSPLNTQTPSLNIEMQETNEQFMQLTTSVPSPKFGEFSPAASPIQVGKMLTQQGAEETQEVSQERLLVQALKKTRTKEPAKSDQMDLEETLLAQCLELQTPTSIQPDQEPMPTRETSSPTDTRCLPSFSGAISSAFKGLVESNPPHSLTRGSFFMQRGMFRD